MTSTEPFTPRTPPPPVAMPGRMLPVPDPEPVEPESDLPELPLDAEPQRRSRRKMLTSLTLWLIAIGLGVLATLLLLDSVLLDRLLLDRDASTTPEEVGAAIDEAFANTTIAPDRGPAIYGTVIQSVVFIQVGDPGDEQGSIGTGTIINADGTIMTSNHVVDSGKAITVTFADGTQTPASVIEAQPELDLATLAPQALPQVVVPVTMGGSVPIGTPVYAIGNPLGLGGSFSAGVVSGLDRTLPLDDGGRLENLIQFDAAVNPGSSGGPLVNANGQVVGIVTALVNPTGSDFFAGIGFAVPIEIAGGAAGGPEQ